MQSTISLVLSRAKASFDLEPYTALKWFLRDRSFWGASKHVPSFYLLVSKRPVVWGATGHVRQTPR